MGDTLEHMFDLVGHPRYIRPYEREQRHARRIRTH